MATRKQHYPRAQGQNWALVTIAAVLLVYVTIPAAIILPLKATVALAFAYAAQHKLLLVTEEIAIGFAICCLTADVLRAAIKAVRQRGTRQRDLAFLKFAVGQRFVRDLPTVENAGSALPMAASQKTLWQRYKSATWIAFKCWGVWYVAKITFLLIYAASGERLTPPAANIITVASVAIAVA